MNEKINYIEFQAKNLPATKEFFRKVFGWTFQDYGNEYTAFSESGIEGGFYQSDLKSEVQTGGALVVLYTYELEATQDRVVDKGGEIVREIFAFPGGRRFHFLEPSGNELAVWSDK